MHKLSHLPINNDRIRWGFITIAATFLFTTSTLKKFKINNNFYKNKYFKDYTCTWLRVSIKRGTFPDFCLDPRKLLPERRFIISNDSITENQTCTCFETLSMNRTYMSCSCLMPERISTLNIMYFQNCNNFNRQFNSNYA